VTVIFITHKLDEVMANADSVTVLRRGKHILSKEIRETSPAELAAAMVGNPSSPSPSSRSREEGSQSPSSQPSSQGWEEGRGGGIRFALEDLLGAGAIIAALKNLSSSPEAKAARATFLGAKPQLLMRLLACGSGLELIDKGKEADVHYAALLNSLTVAPRLTDGIFSNTPTPDDRTLS
jgi:energy-coupling factor transporter ATP-binding protein EcfA2